VDYYSTTAGASLAAHHSPESSKIVAWAHPVRLVGHLEVGTHSGPAPIRFGGCWPDKEFESTPGSLSSGANPEETSETLVMKSIR
jgi:hypothetical protein